MKIILSSLLLTSTIAFAAPGVSAKKMPNGDVGICVSDGAASGCPVGINSQGQSVLNRPIAGPAVSNFRFNIYKENVSESANKMSGSLPRTVTPGKQLVTITFTYVYANSNGTSMQTKPRINILDGVTPVLNNVGSAVIVPSGFNNTIVTTYSFILDYPKAANFTIEAFEENTGGGSRSSTRAFLSANNSLVTL